MQSASKTAKRTLIELKARCAEPEKVHAELLAMGADFKGTDHQTDTYFEVPSGGRFKLRRGNIENSLIHYFRPDQADLKQSDVKLFRPADLEKADALEQVLRTALNVKVEVKKTRRIYFIDHVKFHVDTVEGLGSFMEIEAIDADGTITVETLTKSCAHYRAHFEIKDEDLLKGSYSDMLLAKSSK